MPTIKQTAAERLNDRTTNSQYNALLKQFTKPADAGQRSYTILKSNLQTHTEFLLRQNGFKLEEGDEHGFKAYKIGW